MTKTWGNVMHDVIIVGAGAAGLVLAAELRLAGVRPVVLERQPRRREVPRANGLGGQVVHLLRYRGVLARLETAARKVRPAPNLPFGGVQLDLSHLSEPEFLSLAIPQPVLERTLAEYTAELGAEVREGHEVVGLRQDANSVTVAVQGPDGPYELQARYVVGCDGGRSRVRDLLGLDFPGTTYPEVNRLVEATLPASVSRRADGGLDVPGLGEVRPGFTRTAGGVFAFGAIGPDHLMINTVEEDSTEYDDNPMTEAEFQGSITRILGAALPLGEVRRLSRYQWQGRQVERYRTGRVFLAGDAAHLLASSGASLNLGMLDSVNLAWKLAAAVQGWAPEALLDSYHAERHPAGARALLQTSAQAALRRGHDTAADSLRALFQELLTDEQPLRRLTAVIGGADLRYPMPGSDHALAGTFAADFALTTDDGPTDLAALLRDGRPVFLDLADRPDLRAVAEEWSPRVETHTAKADAGPADALLIRPDAHLAWIAAGSPLDATTLREALTTWFGAPGRLTRDDHQE
ncbi:FAD-dependent monooxygenase [Amycolatopsis rhabdoformis]|uniref:FAD-dependent monooxygenase n=1 Tax=Amycolatopsis rhabdoformis TaxID=1448059 RepID=A0ABZ1HVV7_9PSEU|nr:FAD-dependent monooxygenase [Amycolatopsis rhabdoformis]WSE26397.1 FAD-dependent monooxygenase [Amycolatopsis rhabdoformis]